MAKENKVSFKQKVSGLWGKAKSMWNVPPKGRYLTLKEMGSFGIYALGVAFFTAAVNYVATVAFIPYFYRIASIHGYIIMALSSFVNMCILPFIANKMEKTKTKWGRYKPYIIFTLPLYVILIVLGTWIPQFDKESNRIIYAYMTMVPLLITNGFFYNMYQTMPTLITPETQERADLMTPIGLIFGFAPSILQLIIGPIRAAFIENEFMAIRIIGIVCVVLGLVCSLFILKVKERTYSIEAEENSHEKVKMKEALKELGKNKPLIILTIALILGSLREFTSQFRQFIFQFRFAEDVTTALNVLGIPMTIVGFSATVSMLLLPIVTRKMDKKNIMILFTAMPALCNIILAAIGHKNIPVGTVSAVVITLVHFIMQITPLYLLIPILLGELADYQQATTGKRLDGHIQNMLFIVPALVSQLLMIGISFLQEDVVGFKLMEYQGLEKLTEAQSLVACQWFDVAAIISAVSGILMVIVLLFYPLTRKKHQEIVNKLKEESVITNVGVVTADGEILKVDSIAEAKEIEKEREIEAETEEEKVEENFEFNEEKVEENTESEVERENENVESEVEREEDKTLDNEEK